jgi:hypothetical protein
VHIHFEQTIRQCQDEEEEDEEENVIRYTSIPEEGRGSKCQQVGPTG